MFDIVEIQGSGVAFNDEYENWDAFFTEYKATFNTLMYGEDEEGDFEKQVSMIAIDFTMINTGEMMNRGLYDFEVFDSRNGDMEALFSNFIEFETGNVKEILDTDGFIGQILYIENVEKLINNTTNAHIAHAIKDIICRYARGDGLSVFYKGEGENEDQLYAVLKSMEWRSNPLDSKWLYWENNRINPKLLKVA